ncbi:MAG: hypothetical protein JWM14_3373 [Chitinophagaceae bacterium]|nr:hypothetical protein [Chitinophagaceae bacterium]
MNPKYAFLLCLFGVLLFSCEHHTTKVERAFYYWKNTSEELTHIDMRYLELQSTNKLYVKFFEVERNEEFGLIPTAKSSLRLRRYSYNYRNDSLRTVILDRLHIVPTVYIRNNIFAHTNPGELDSLADNIVFLIHKYYEEKYDDLPADYKEIQIDCDWTPSTKDHYFYLLKKIKALSAKTLSATLRLYPYKYPDKMGVLPVDKAMLMCYNMSSPLSHENQNSIIDESELKKYLKDTKKYPVHLDIALPVYQWMHWYHNNSFFGILPSENLQRVQYASKKIKPLWYIIEKDIVIDNHLLKAGDKIKLEEADPQTIRKSIDQIQRYVPLDDSTTVSLFHLDEKNLSHYTHETLSAFYTDFTR